MGFHGPGLGQDALGQEAPLQLVSRTAVEKPWSQVQDVKGPWASGRTNLVPGPLQQQQPQLFQAAVDAVPAPLLHQRLQHL